MELLNLGCNPCPEGNVPYDAGIVVETGAAFGGNAGFLVVQPALLTAIEADPTIILTPANIDLSVADDKLTGMFSCTYLSVTLSEPTSNLVDMGVCGAQVNTGKTQSVEILYNGKTADGKEYDFFRWLCVNAQCKGFIFVKCDRKSGVMYGTPSSVVVTRVEGQKSTDLSGHKATLVFKLDACGDSDLSTPIALNPDTILNSILQA